MTGILRRGFVTTLVAGVAAGPASAQAQDGHAAGRDAAPFAGGTPLLVPRSGEAPVFSVSLDRTALKATSGGWAREITARQLPIATDIALAHLFLNPGGAREMHWHNSAEWAYVMAGCAQVTIVDPDGTTEVFNVNVGDLWYFPRGYAHAIQTIGSEPCHALLAFDDGLYSEHGTFGISDLVSHLSPGALAQSLGVAEPALANLPRGETYIMQGKVLPVGGAEAVAERPREANRSRRLGLLSSRPVVDAAGGTIHVASAVEFPASTAITGLLIRLARGAMQALHWHPDTSEMHYVVSGRARITMYGPDKHLGVAEVGPGDCAYIPRNAAHMIENIGPGMAEIIAVQNGGMASTATLSDWMAGAPRHLLANNLGLAEADVPAFRNRQAIAAAG